MKSILRIISSANPSHGGPIQAIMHMQPALEALGYRQEILTVDDPNEDWIKSSKLTIHAVGPGRGPLGTTPNFTPWLAAHHQNYDHFVVHGLWHYINEAASKALTDLKRPYALYTHGMLDPWFNKTYPKKFIKKYGYWLLAERKTLSRAARVLFTSSEEMRKAALAFKPYSAKGTVVRYGAPAPPQGKNGTSDEIYEKFPMLRGKRIVLFLGRLHEKKGIDLLVHGLASSGAVNSGYELVIAGPDHDGLQAELISLAKSLGVDDHVHWTGMISGEMKWSALKACEVFALTSHQENFGVSVAEALACSKPVMVSTSIDIWKDIVGDKAGLASEATPVGTGNMFSEWIQKSESEKAEFASHALACYQNRYRIEDAAKDLVDKLEEIATSK